MGGGATPLAPRLLVRGVLGLALPVRSAFLAELLVLVGTFTQYKAYALVATTGIILAALYILLAYQRTMQGALSTAHETMKDLGVREVAALAPLIALMLFLGFYPKPLTDIINPAVAATMHDVGAPDPVPTDVHASGSK